MLFIDVADGDVAGAVRAAAILAATSGRGSHRHDGQADDQRGHAQPLGGDRAVHQPVGPL